MDTTGYQFLFGILLMLFFISANSQSLSNPESVTYDNDTKSYFVSNATGGSIQNIDENGHIVSFADGYESFLGIKIYDGVVYCAENRKDEDDFIRGFDKSSGKLVFSLSIPQTIQLNDIETDNEGHLYVSDRGGNKIFQVNLESKNFEIIDSTIKTPNGLYFNSKKASLLVCNTVEESSLYEIDLKECKTRLLVATTYPNLDGLTMDNNGMIYLSSWSLDWTKSRLLKYDGKQFFELLTNDFGMADMEYNSKSHILTIAKYYDNSILHLKID